MTEFDLFGDVVEPPPLEPEGTKSRGVRLTERQKADVERGVHPLTGEPARPDLGTCGDCALRQHHAGGSRYYPKCDRPGVMKGHSAASDVRAWWPACPGFRPKAEGE